MDVTVYERNAEGTLGYDWTDIFAPTAWKAAGMDMPPRDKYEYKTNMTFYSPGLQIPLTQSIPANELEIKMERKDIYNQLITHAVRCGVKFVYDCTITGPVLSGNRVTGINTDKGSFYGDLIIDAAGVNSPVRKNLPAVCGIEKEPRPCEKLFVYRAFYNYLSEREPDAKYKIYLLPNGKKGIAWVSAENGFTDLLIGDFEPFDMKAAEETAEFLRNTSPWLGKKLLRGGQFTEIPVRQPLSVMVCDGYAAIGDSAFMTMPIIGSGIANSFKAARMLADTVLADKAGAYSADTLWPYQVQYYKKIGAGLSQIACIKSLLLSITPAELDYCFEKGILTAEDFALGSETTGLTGMVKLKPADIYLRGKALLDEHELLKKVLQLGCKIGKAAVITKVMPRKRSAGSVSNWAKQYIDLFASII